MAITFPRPLPMNLIERATFDLERFVATDQLYGGDTLVRDFAPARWRAAFTTSQLVRDNAQIWRAWWNSLRGGLRQFLAHDPERRYPLNYRTGFTGLTRAGGGAFDGTATVTGLTTTTIAVGTLPAGFVLKAGDLVGLVEDGAYGLHEISEDATANGSGAVTVTVEPFVLTNVFDNDSVANFAEPSCIMTPDTSSWSAERQFAAPISFAGVEKPI